MLTEIWKDVVGYEGRYQVSNLGRVKYFKSKVGKIKKQQTDKDGYKFVTLYNGNKYIGKRTARLVCEHFLNSWNPKLEVNHINGSKTDNNVVNLEMCSRSENQKHAYDMGLQKDGINFKRSALSEQDVLEIRKLRGLIPQRKLAKQFLVSQHTIMSIQTYKTYKRLL